MELELEQEVHRVFGKVRADIRLLGSVRRDQAQDRPPFGAGAGVADGGSDATSLLHFPQPHNKLVRQRPRDPPREPEGDRGAPELQLPGGVSAVRGGGVRVERVQRPQVRHHRAAGLHPLPPHPLLLGNSVPRRPVRAGEEGGLAGAAARQEDAGAGRPVVQVAGALQSDAGQRVEEKRARSRQPSEFKFLFWFFKCKSISIMKYCNFKASV